MFAGIAHRYDFLNHFLSASVDRYWRKHAVQRVASLIHSQAFPRCLDVCSGTGDLALDLHRYLKADVVASDFCHPMLTRSKAKTVAKGFQSFVQTVEADALVLPFPDRSFDSVTVAFGLRNLADPERGLAEMRRVLRDGGAVVVLEFSKPVVPVFRHLFNFYFRYILPRLGAAISGDGSAYQYLPDSVRRFPAQEELARLLRSTGFDEVEYRNLTGGVAALHWGKK
jgi:demethylmenaquinone methyltransferase/2-methoxy-6-polyprenyl-1,4-benzoquinol methylase